MSHFHRRGKNISDTQELAHGHPAGKLFRSLPRSLRILSLLKSWSPPNVTRNKSQTARLSPSRPNFLERPLPHHSDRDFLPVCAKRRIRGFSRSLNLLSFLLDNSFLWPLQTTLNSPSTPSSHYFLILSGFLPLFFLIILFLLTRTNSCY